MQHFDIYLFLRLPNNDNTNEFDHDVSNNRIIDYYCYSNLFFLLGDVCVSSNKVWSWYFCVNLVPCSSPLGLETGEIPYWRLSASSRYDNTTGAGNARLNLQASDTYVGAWVAGADDLNQWLRVSLYRQTNVTGVQIQGRPSADQWVTKFKVETSLGNDIWTNVTKQDGQVAVSCYLFWRI